MRPTTDLLEHDFVFSQQTLLTPDHFINEYKRRELHPSRALSVWDQLEALHEAEVLVPLYRFVKNVDPILDESRRRRLPLVSVLVQQLGDQATLSNYLHGHTAGGYPVDPRAETFEPWPTYIRKVRGHLLWTSMLLYSPYQILLAEALWPVLQRRILNALQRKTHSHIPAVRIALLAVDRANRLRRHSVMIRKKGERTKA